MAVSEVLAALADETRRQILLKLKEGRINSGDLANALNMTPQALSYHLSKLKKADLILVSAKGNVKNSRLLRQFEKKCRVIPFCVSDTYLQKGSAYAAGIRSAILCRM